METVNLYKLFNITTDSEDIYVEESYTKLKKNIITKEEQRDLLENYNKVSTKEKRYLYSLTSLKGFRDISELDKEIISQPNYIGPRKWLELL